MTTRPGRAARAASIALASALATLVGVNRSAAQCVVETDLEQPTLWGAQYPSRFGSAIAFDGRRMIVGAAAEQSIASTGTVSSNLGAAYVYRLTPAGPVQEGRLAPPEPYGGTFQLGRFVALSGSLAAISNGFVRLELYSSSDGRWRHAASLTRRHQSLSLERGWLALGDPATQNADSSLGVVALYQPSATGLVEVQALTPPEPGLVSFGRAVELFGNRLAVGADERILMYVHDGSSWTFEEALGVAPATSDDRFGEAFDATEDLLVISALGGAEAYVFRRTASGWAQEQILTAPDPAAVGFGRRVATSGQFVAVDSIVSSRRRVHLFKTSNGVWTALGDLSIPISTSIEWALGPAELAVASQYMLTPGGEGMVQLLENIADCDADGLLDHCQVDAGMSTDCNGNGLLDGCDVSAGTSHDVNANGIPDECEADCDGDGAPDEWEILQGDAADVNTNSVPDDCETDCNGDGVPDDLPQFPRPYLCACAVDAPRSLMVNSPRLGRGMDRDGDALIVSGGFSTGSAAHAFRRHGSTWQHQQDLAYGPGGEDYAAVAVDGRRVLVGAPYSGRLQAFELTGDDWVHQQTVVPPTGTTDGLFGAALVIEGDLALVGAPGEPGTVHILRHDGANWTHNGALPMSALRTGFGTALDLDGDLVAVGSPQDSVVKVTDHLGERAGATGAVYLFRFDGSQWIQEHRLACPDPYVADEFGAGVALRGGRLLVVAPHPAGVSPSSQPSRSTIYEFGRQGQDWVLQARIRTREQFGDAIALEGDRLLTSLSFGSFGGLTGTRTVLYDRTLDQGWIPSLVIRDRFGHALHFGDGQALISNQASERVTVVNGLGDCDGNVQLDACDINAGSLPDTNVNLVPDSCECVGDLDLNGAADLFDLLAFLDAWFDQSPDGDFDASASADVFDLLGFLNAWFAGC